MTKEEFEVTFCNKSNTTIDKYREFLVTLPCNCEDELCLGWAAVNNDSLNVKNHTRLYT